MPAPPPCAQGRVCFSPCGLHGTGLAGWALGLGVDVFISCALQLAVSGRGLERAPHVFKCILDVEAFAKAMQNSARSEQEGDGKDKKDEEEDMSLD